MADPDAARAPVAELPAITDANAADFQPPDLRQFRAAASRTADSRPGLWFKQMTGTEWDGEGHSYELEKKRHRRMLAEQQTREREREVKRDRSGRAKQTNRPPAEEQRAYKAQRREEQRPERERAQAAAAAEREVQKQRDRDLSAAYWCRRDRMQAHFVRLLSRAGVHSPEMFLDAATWKPRSFGGGEGNPGAPQPECALIYLHVDDQTLTARMLTEKLLQYAGEYCDYMYEHEDMLEQTAIGRAALAGTSALSNSLNPWGWGTHPEHAAVQQGLLPVAFAACKPSPKPWWTGHIESDSIWRDPDDFDMCRIADFLKLRRDTRVLAYRMGDDGYRRSVELGDGLKDVRRGSRMSLEEAENVVIACCHWLDEQDAASKGYPVC